MTDYRINDVAGALVFWQFSPGTELYKLRLALEANGFQNHSPERMTDGAALRAALAAEYPGHKVFPVDVEGKTVFEVVKIVPEKDRNNYTHVLTASVDGKQYVSTDDDIDAEAYKRIVESFEGYTTLVPTSQLTAVMVDIVASLGGLSMRPSGGVYFLADAQWLRWKSLADSIEGTGPKNRFDACRVVFDANCIKAVQEALTAEVTKEAAAIEETLADPDTGKRAASTAQKKAAALREKVAEYERAFNLALPALVEQIDNAERIEATATIMDAANQLTMFAIAG